MRKHVGFVGAVISLIASTGTLSPAWGQAATGGSAGQSTELLIAHSLCMAIEGSEMQLTIHQGGGPVMASRTDIGVARASGAAGETGAVVNGPGRGSVMQLQHQVRRSFQASYELMKTSNRLLRGGSEARSERASASRLYAASNLYANTLYSLGRQTFGWQTGWEPTDKPEGDRGQGDKPGQDKERGADHSAAAGRAKLSPADVTAITLINHSVKGSLAAFTLHQALRGKGADDAAAQQLHEHAKKMVAESRQAVEQIIASLREKEGSTPEGKTPTSGTHEGWSGTQIQALAQQAREVVRVLDEICGEESKARTPGR